MDFVNKQSIVRKIWGNADIILFIFAGAAAEFSLNKAVDWLYFTGKLPKDPLGRLFSTVTYSQKIVFATLDEANKSIDQITQIHNHVEANRNAKIPDWAYRDVLFMLINYSIRAFELLERQLSPSEKEEIFNTFYRVGLRMKIDGLPRTFTEWQVMHRKQLQENLVHSELSKDLFKQYKKHLGFPRFYIMTKVQALIVPAQVNQLLQLGKGNSIRPVLHLYKMSKNFNLHRTLRNLFLPSKYKAQILGFEAFR